MADARVVADESSICDCISETYVVNFAGELFQSDLISDASYQAAIAEDSVLSPAHKVAHLVFEVVSKVGASPSNYKFIFRPGTQTLSRPGKPHATNVTHNSLELSWEKPQYGADSVQSYTITYRAKDDPPGRWITQTSQSELEHTELTHLAVETTYIFKVRAESASGTSGPYSETSDPIETTSYPEELKQLEMLIYSLQPLFRAKLAKTDELRQENRMLLDCEADIIVNKDFTFQVQVTKQRKTNLPTGEYTTNCLMCNYILVTIPAKLLMIMISTRVVRWMILVQQMHAVQFVLVDAHGDIILTIPSELNYIKNMKQGPIMTSKPDMIRQWLERVKLRLQ